MISNSTPSDMLSGLEDLIENNNSPENFGLILSASGWRGIFADTEESPKPRPGAVMRLAALALAAAAADFFGEQKELSGISRILLGCDARPTGPALCDIFARVFISRGLTPEYLAISAAPEIMAAARDSTLYSGFCYISASHNPVGHNGVKLGSCDGGVLPAEKAVRLIKRISDILADAPAMRRILKAAQAVKPEITATIYAGSAGWKKKALNAYFNFTREVVFGDYPSKEKELSAALENNPLGVVAELNGSARGTSIDGDLFKSLNLQFELHNNTPGDIRHAILPEGESLIPCCEYLEKAWRQNPAYLFGYVPDNDGDRGNLVYLDPDTGKAHALGAQEVFAISCLAELSCHRLFAENREADLAVAVNGPTSVRIDRIAEIFGARVYRSEVGEANVVNLAREIRAAGTTVRIFGEGSNGGTITYPAAVRDPLNTVLAFTKMFRLATPQGLSPAEDWLNRAGKPLEKGQTLSVPRILNSLPAYCTTPTGEARAKYPVKTADHNLLKTRYEAIFPSEWKRRPEYLKDSGISAYRFINYEGTKSFTGPGGRTGNGRGGFKVELLDGSGVPRGFLWMRGSGTEPVFRVMADIAAENPETEKALLDWHRKILAKADA